MSQNDNTQDQPALEARENDEQLTDETLESVAGGITQGGCMEPWIIVCPPPPILIDIDYNSVGG